MARAMGREAGVSARRRARRRGSLLRRCVTIPLYALLFVASVGAVAVLVPIAIGVDLVRGRPFPLVRVLIFFVWYLGCEVAGIVASACLWLVAGPWTGRDRRSWEASNYALQHRWSQALGAGAFRIFGIDTRIVGQVPVGRPILLLLRHASVADTVLAALLVANPYGIRLRYVLKRELLWDPCLDIVGNRLPNAFIDRASIDGAREVAAVGDLMEGLGANDGVLIYPEGTRFTAAKRERVLERIARSRDRAALERARSYRFVLPPRPRGVLELLARNRGADVVFCAHTGFEGSGSFLDLYSGRLVGETIRVRFWTVPFAGLPVETAERERWLHEQWRLVDEFVAVHRDRSGDEPA